MPLDHSSKVAAAGNINRNSKYFLLANTFSRESIWWKDPLDTTFCWSYEILISHNPVVYHLFHIGGSDWEFLFLFFCPYFVLHVSCFTNVVFIPQSAVNWYPLSNFCFTIAVCGTIQISSWTFFVRILTQLVLE